MSCKWGDIVSIGPGTNRSQCHPGSDVCTDKRARAGTHTRARDKYCRPLLPRYFEWFGKKSRLALSDMESLNVTEWLGSDDWNPPSPPGLFNEPSPDRQSTNIISRHKCFLGIYKIDYRCRNSQLQEHTWFVGYVNHRLKTIATHAIEM